MLLKVLVRFGERTSPPQGGARVLFDKMLEGEIGNGDACYYKFYMQFDVSPRAC